MQVILLSPTIHHTFFGTIICMASASHISVSLLRKQHNLCNGCGYPRNCGCFLMFLREDDK